MAIYYTIFILAILLSMLGHAYLAVKNNEATNHTPWIVGQYVYGMIFVSPIWIIASMKSKNIVFDGLVYDLLVTVVYVFYLSWFSKTSLSFDFWSIFGLILCITGLVIFKVRMI